MYIRRKIFSVLEIEGEERLFSTTEVEIETPRRLRKEDAKWIKKYKKRGQKFRDNNIALFEGDSEPLARTAAKRLGTAVGIAGGISGATIAGSGGSKVAKAGKILAGTAIGAGVGGGVGYGAAKLDGKILERNRKRDYLVDKEAERELARLKVANGDMSEEEYMDNYGSR